MCGLNSASIRLHFRTLKKESPNSIVYGYGWLIVSAEFLIMYSLEDFVYE